MRTVSQMDTAQVCMLTYKRPVLFRIALESLLRQDLDGCPLAACILVVDNDAAQSGRAVFEAVVSEARAEGRSALDARYVCQPGKGLSSARNRAMQESAGMDYIVFIDDDEVAEPHWLKALYRAIQTSGADIATGPVLPIFHDAPEWVVRGDFFSTRTHSHLSPIKFVATANVMFRGQIASSFQFDSRFDTTGGEDTHFFMRLRNAGCRIVWAADAPIHEHIPPYRANAPWLRQRARSDANRFTRCCLYLAPGPRTRATRLAKALLGMGGGIALMPLGIFSQHWRVRAMRWINRGLGTVAALRGHEDVYYPPEKAVPLAAGEMGAPLGN